MTEDLTTPTSDQRYAALMGLIISTYEEIAGINEPRLDKLKMQLVGAYAGALRQRRSFEMAAKAAAKEAGAKKGGKK